MNKLVTSALAAAAITALPTTALAEKLEYDFNMEITSLQDGYGVFSGLSQGDSLNLSILLDTKGDWDGVAQMSISEVTFTSTGAWSWSWSDVQYNPWGLTWDAYAGTVTGSLIVNGVLIDHTVSYHQDLYLDFSKTSSGDYEVTSGWLDLRIENGSRAQIKATYVDKPAESVPELDAKSGSQAMALLGGGAFILLSRRRRQGLDIVTG